jgi:nitrile hydratase subunit beta
MDGMHDLGGKEGFGIVDAGSPEAPFRARWEATVFAMTRAAALAGAIRNTDQFRHAIERIDPIAYLTHGYYGRWLGALETLLVEAGTLAADEIQARYLALGGDISDLVAARPRAGAVLPPPPSASGSERAPGGAARYEIGARVRTVAHGHSGHTRLPGYARGRRGTIADVHGTWVYPDTNAHGAGEQPQAVYCVAFDATEIWGAGADAACRIHLDLFESYLEADDG